MSRHRLRELPRKVHVLAENSMLTSLLHEVPVIAEKQDVLAVLG
jgi:hypothetical protein